MRTEFFCVAERSNSAILYLVGLVLASPKFNLFAPRGEYIYMGQRNPFFWVVSAIPPTDVDGWEIDDLRQQYDQDDVEVEVGLGVACLWFCWVSILVFRFTVNCCTVTHGGVRQAESEQNEVKITCARNPPRNAIIASIGRKHGESIDKARNVRPS
jgi:hypothetical protein